jgi:hypothetical protein
MFSKYYILITCKWLYRPSHFAGVFWCALTPLAHGSCLSFCTTILSEQVLDSTPPTDIRKALPRHSDLSSLHIGASTAFIRDTEFHYQPTVLLRSGDNVLTCRWIKGLESRSASSSEILIESCRMGNVNGIGGWKEGHNSCEDMPCDLAERCRPLGETAASCGEFSESLAPFLLSAWRRNFENCRWSFCDAKISLCGKVFFFRFTGSMSWNYIVSFGRRFRVVGSLSFLEVSGQISSRTSTILF